MKVKGIARYEHVLEPSAPKGTEKLTYSIQLLIHKSDNQIPLIEQEINQTINNGFPQGAPSNFNTCFFDVAIEEPENEELKDYMCLKASVGADKIKPPVVELINGDLTPITQPGFQIDGKLVWIDGNFGTYNVGSNGVKMYLNGTCVTQEAGPIPLEFISSKPTVEQMFNDIVSPSVSSVNTKTSSSQPTPPLPAPPAANVRNSYTMTDKAEGRTREQFIATGWTDELLIKEGYMVPPNGVNPSFI